MFVTDDHNTSIYSVNMEVKSNQCHRLPFEPSQSKTTRLLELVHSDVAGPIEVKSLAGSRYILTFLDDFSHKSFVYFLKTKDQVSEHIEIFKTFAENQTGQKLKILRTDNGGEYCNSRVFNFLEKSGILHQKSCPSTPQQNSKAERLNRTLMDRARCMLAESQLPNLFWAEAVYAAAYLLNRSPCKSHSSTPEEIWSGKKPKLSHIRIFGCKAFAHVPSDRRRKLDKRATVCIFLGYSLESKAYRLYNPANRRVFLSRDVRFSESENGSTLLQHTRQKSDENGFYDFAKLPALEKIQDEPDSSPQSNQDEPDSSPQSNQDEPAVSSPQPNQDESVDVTSEDESDPDFEPPSTVSEVSALQPSSQRSRRTPQLPSKFNDFVMAVMNAEPNDPDTYQNAMESSDADIWKQAMDCEFKSQQDNKTWELVDLPPGKRPLDCRWVFRSKRDANGQIVQHKARLVVKGCAQQKGTDFEETFSPVVRYTSIRFIFALAAQLDLDIDQMDAVSAFLQGDLTEEIYMTQPIGYRDNTNRVCRLKKSIYGLKQASRAWNLKLDACLKEIGLLQSKFDTCVYYKRSDGGLLIVAVWVDDFLIFSDNKKLKKQLKTHLTKTFKMTDMGAAKFVLGFQITRDRNSKKIWISQQAYLEQVLKRFNMENSNPSRIPMSSNEKLSHQQEPKSEEERMKMNKIPYQEAVGSLLFASQVSRPDIAQAVNSVSRFNGNPGPAHWIAVKRILRYVRGTTDYKLQFDGNKSSVMHGYCDADWAADIDERRSLTGYIFVKCDAPISWCTKRQPTVALSTTEAEYMSLSAATQEALWLRGISLELMPASCIGPTRIFVDNEGARKLALNGAYQARTKHIDVRHHFVRERIQKKEIELEYIPSAEMVADSLTKPLDAEKFESYVGRSQYFHLLCKYGSKNTFTQNHFQNKCLCVRQWSLGSESIEGLFDEASPGLKHSTIDQVHRIVNIIEEALEKKNVCSGIFLDVAQAFDKVWHEGLNHKLKKMLPYQYVELLESYLSRRYFCIKQEDAYSEPRTINAGVPQGSVIGPLLYLLYTCDLPETEENTTATFADDTAILAVGESNEESTQKLNRAISRISSWTAKWRIRLNEAKSVHIDFTNRSIVKMYWLIGRQSTMTIGNKLLLYNQVLKPVWSYGAQLWGCTAPTNRQIIQRFQNSVLRCITDAPWYFRNDALHRELNVDSVDQVIKQRASAHLTRLRDHLNEEAVKLLDVEDLTRRLKRTKPHELA
ncbi:unnamed protein product [Nesidiocoris tenuis]|uniref:Integrase catalytic domain-containing protein n=2 Tax=Nesidiocoris tenuis TaxID=355587 RepID=A0A6H5FV69_9HEMI|nr:unnamed protein product [Nesidiocoris tenuis]